MKVLGYNPKKTRWRVELWHREAYTHTFQNNHRQRIPEAYTWVVLQEKAITTPPNQSIWYDHYEAKDIDIITTYPRNIVFEVYLQHRHTTVVKSSMYSTYNVIEENANKYQLTLQNNGVNDFLNNIGKGKYTVNKLGVIGPCVMTFINSSGACYICPYDIAREGQPIPIQQ